MGEPNDYIVITGAIGVIGCSLVLLALSVCLAWWVARRFMRLLAEIAYGRAARDYYASWDNQSRTPQTVERRSREVIND